MKTDLCSILCLLGLFFTCPICTTLPCVSATLPCVCATLPCVCATLPCVCATLPCVCATLPCVCATLPCVCATLPCVCATLPCVCATLPCVCATLPCVCAIHKEEPETVSNIFIHCCTIFSNDWCHCTAIASKVESMIMQTEEHLPC